MSPNQNATKRGKLFDSLVLEFNLPLRLHFDIFDFPLAQRWASLLWAYSENPLRDWTTIVPSSYLMTLQDELEFLIASLANDEDSASLVRRLEKKDGAYTPAALKEIRSSRFFHQATREASAHEVQLLKILHAKTGDMERELYKNKKICLSNFGLLPKHLKSYMTQPLEEEDFLHFQDRRLPGGVRLRQADEGNSALLCANSLNPHFLPMPMRNFGMAFRVDLSPFAPHPDQWESHQNLVRWAKDRQFDLIDRRQWSDCVYVARLRSDDLSRMEEIAKTIASAPNLEVSRIFLSPSPRKRIMEPETDEL